MKKIMFVLSLLVMTSHVALAEWDCQPLRKSSMLSYTAKCNEYTGRVTFKNIRLKIDGTKTRLNRQSGELFCEFMNMWYWDTDGHYLNFIGIETYKKARSLEVKNGNIVVGREIKTSWKTKSIVCSTPGFIPPPKPLLE